MQVNEKHLKEKTFVCNHEDGNCVKNVIDIEANKKRSGYVPGAVDLY